MSQTSSFNGRELTWTNHEKEPSRGVIRDGYIVVMATQEESPLSKMVIQKMQPVWVMAVEVLEPEKHKGRVVPIPTNDASVRFGPMHKETE